MISSRNRAMTVLVGLVGSIVAMPGSPVAQPLAHAARVDPVARECVLARPAALPPLRQDAAERACDAFYGSQRPWSGRPAGLRPSATGSLDLAVARAIRRSDLQENGTAQAVAGVFRVASLPGTLLLAGVLYGIGELEDRSELSDLGLHAGQAIVGAGAVTLAGKIAAGRARPHLSPENASDFEFGRGLRGDDYQAFPSAHTAAAFAAGTVIAMDVAGRHPDSAAWVYPTTYGAAAMAGLSRLFDEEHWASDILAGALIGIAAGLIVDEWQGGGSVP